MKKAVLILFVLMSLAKISEAQKGSWLLYGNAGFGSSSDSFDFKSNAYTISPGIGYQFKDRWTAGLNFSFGGTRNEIPASPEVPSGNYDETSFFNVGPFLRYSYPISDIFSIYGQAEVSYLSGNITPYGLDGGSYTGFGADFFPAIGVNIKNGFALNLSFGGISYQTKSYKGQYYSNQIPSAANSASQFAITFGQGATFGISKNFGGEKHKS